MEGWGDVSLPALSQMRSPLIFSLQLAEYKLVSQCMAHNLSGFYFLYFHISLFLARGRGKRSIDKPLLLCAIIFFSFSKQGVLPCFIPHRVLLSHKKLEESLSSESFLPFVTVQFSFFFLFLFVGFCSFALSFMSKSWLRLVVLKVEPTTFAH